jgi:hypothetical protein
MTTMMTLWNPAFDDLNWRFHDLCVRVFDLRAEADALGV